MYLLTNYIFKLHRRKWHLKHIRCC